MINIEKIVTPSPEQWEIVIEGMRNPHNSWDRIDSYMTRVENPETLNTAPFEFFAGENDQDLMARLCKGGSVHRKYMRMLPVWITINAPLYFWKEFDTYKIGTVANSCSTMHTISDKEFTLDNFSHELLGVDSLSVLQFTINHLNRCRKCYLETHDEDHWRQMIQLLPSSYNQKRTVMVNYEVLAAMYYWRNKHKLDEWRRFCEWMKTLPYSELITGEGLDGMLKPAATDVAKSAAADVLKSAT